MQEEEDELDWITQHKIGTHQNMNRRVGPVNFANLGMGMSLVFCAFVGCVKSLHDNKERQIINPAVAHCVISAIYWPPHGSDVTVQCTFSFQSIRQRYSQYK